MAELGMSGEDSSIEQKNEVLLIYLFIYIIRS